MFIKTNVEDALKESILLNLKDREAKACSTWDLKATLGYAVGVKESLELSEIEEVSAYGEKVQGSKLTLTDGRRVDLLKIDVKSRKDTAFLIFRYQLIFDEPKSQFANVL